MKYWVKVLFEYTEQTSIPVEVKSSHYYRENNDNTILHVSVPSIITLLEKLPRDYIYNQVTQEEFNKVLKNTIDYMGVNITNHKFIKDAEK